MRRTSDYKNDKRWAKMAAWGKDLGVNSWNKDIVNMDTIHPRLFMGSRLSAQEVIDKGKLMDQNGKYYNANKFYCVCVASPATCEYCKISAKYSTYDVQDINHEDDDFLNTVIKTAHCIRTSLAKGRYVLVHCHTGRNRSALAILVYCAMYTDKTYENSLHEIRQSNSSRFSTQKTLQNSTFTSYVRKNWEDLRSKKEKKSASCCVIM
jgi:protein-tyrosine phosphatase